MNDTVLFLSWDLRVQQLPRPVFSARTSVSLGISQELHTRQILLLSSMVLALGFLRGPSSGFLSMFLSTVLFPFVCTFSIRSLNVGLSQGSIAGPPFHVQTFSSGYPNYMLAIPRCLPQLCSSRACLPAPWVLL